MTFLFMIIGLVIGQQYDSPIIGMAIGLVIGLAFE